MSEVRESSYVDHSEALLVVVVVVVAVVVVVGGPVQLPAGPWVSPVGSGGHGAFLLPPSYPPVDGRHTDPGLG